MRNILSGVQEEDILTSSCKLTRSSSICAHLSLCLALLWPQICSRLHIGRTDLVIKASTYCFTSELLYIGDLKKMSLVVRKPVFGVSDQVHTKQAVQLKKMARGMKFRI